MFEISPDNRWIIHSQIEAEDNSFTSRKWISLENTSLSVNTLELNTLDLSNTFVFSSLIFSPDTTRILFFEHAIDADQQQIISSQLGYEPLLIPLPGNRMSQRIAMPDNCKGFTSDSSSQPIKYFITNCDQPMSELWWNPSFSGQGVSTQQKGDRIQATWFLFDKTGEPLWLDFSGKLVNNQLRNVHEIT